MMTQQELDKRFNYHAPIGDKANKHEMVRDECKALAFNLSQICPDSRELSLAITNLEETMMWANAAIARN